MYAKVMQMSGEITLMRSLMWQVSVSSLMWQDSDSLWEATPHHSNICCLSGKNCSGLSLFADADARGTSTSVHSEPPVLLSPPLPCSRGEETAVAEAPSAKGDGEERGGSK